MQEFNIDLGSKEVYTLKNLTFDINNFGSADLQITDIRLSSNDIVMLYTNTPFYIIQNKSYTMSGYLKITDYGDSINLDYIEIDVMLLDEHGDEQTDVHRYYLNYTGVINNKYVQILNINNVKYINDIFLLTLDVNESVDNTVYPNIIIHSIDDEPLYIFPKIYRISKTKLVYVYKDNVLTNTIVDDTIQLNLIHDEDAMDIHKLTYRSI